MREGVDATTVEGDGTSVFTGEDNGHVIAEATKAGEESHLPADTHRRSPAQSEVTTAAPGAIHGDLVSGACRGRERQAAAERMTSEIVCIRTIIVACDWCKRVHARPGIHSQHGVEVAAQCCEQHWTTEGSCPRIPE